jgi:tetratricopeptide (TPR) repeat protein
LSFDFNGTASGGEFLSNSEWDILKDEAINYAKKAIELNPEEAHSHFSLAFVYAQARMLKKSMDQNKRALELEPENLLALQMKATNLVNYGEFKEGLQTFKIVRKLDPLFPIFVLLGEARAYLTLGKFEQAFKLSEEALDRNPRSARAMLSYISASWKLGNKEDAKWKMEEFLLTDERSNSDRIDFDVLIDSFPWHQSYKELVKSVHFEIMQDQ